MINRNLIRTRIVQIVYSWYQNANKELRIAEKELIFGLQKSYDLYYYLLLLMLEVTKAYENKVETKRNKFLPTEADLNPNTKLMENRFIKQLAANKQLRSYLAERPMSWDEQESFVRNLLETLLASDIYREYSKSDDDSYDADREFWRKIFKQYIYNNDLLNEILEEESIYWNDDVEVVETFVLKTIKQFSEQNGENQPLLPMFKGEEDREYAVRLLRETLLNEKEYRSLIERHSEKWDFDRIAFMDMIIMQVAIAEIVNFESIPTTVSLNEYIEIAKVYSTQKSGLFVNGVLDAAVSQLRKENKIFKN